MTSDLKPNPSSLAWAALRSLRPSQWTKSGFVFAALVFDGKLLHPTPLLKSVLGFWVLCFLAGAIYIINDLLDIQGDQNHPQKKNRPIASGALPKGTALVLAVVLCAVCLTSAFWLEFLFGIIALGYLLLQLLYSAILKHIVLVDVLTIALGFVLRVAGGVVLVQAERFSPWLYMFTVLLALFLGLGKRRQEIVLLKKHGIHSRSVLAEYNLPLLDALMSIVTTGTIMTYAFYTFSAPNLPANRLMMATIPFLIYGIFRYLYLIHVREESKAPDEVLLSDRSLQICIVLFAIAVVTILYLKPHVTLFAP